MGDPNGGTTGGRSQSPEPRSAGTSRAHHKGIRLGAGAGAAGIGGALFAGATGGSIVGTAESLMSAATDMAAAAGLVLPPALMVSFLYRQSTGKTTKLELSSRDWTDAAQQLHRAAKEITQLVKDIPGEAWTMDDRPLYESHVEDHRQQLDSLGTYCTAVGYSIMGVAWALFTYSVFAMGMAVYLDVLAAAAAVALAATASGVGAVAGGPVYGQCLALAGTALTITAVATGVLASAGTIGAAVLGGGALLTANSQENNGAENAFGALQKAAITGSAGAAANLTQNAANSGINFANRRGEKMMPLAGIDLDADRDIDNTWNVGGGVKGTTPGGAGEGELGYHAKIKDGDLQGQELEIKVKGGPPDVGTVGGGGKIEWDENENLKNKSFTVGAESPKAGVAADYEGTFDQKNDYDAKYNANTPVFNRTDDSFGKKKGDPPPPWDENL
ncbi:hypothetical protein ETD83_25940 [Actinomadura soli]|uniref:Uncharacterized protein n=1 Tax=Actinomadura soli TaxID=2508997 RepID=A0A5C4J8D4_9ACTN|nr:hypothetical protein [Actinomadura soli]TMQ93095.1 hypothetical protein ETD83_25940 [Actinomadura soli]